MLRILENSSLYEAVYDFNSENPDDLQFSNGDIIALYKKVEGGWCEGWCSGRMGWFPLNFTKPVKHEVNNIPIHENTPISPNFFQILESLYEKEVIFVNNFENLYKNFESIVSKSNDNELIKNFTNIETLLDKHRNLVEIFKCNKSSTSNKVTLGPDLFNHFQKLKDAYMNHCNNYSNYMHLIEINSTKLEPHFDSTHTLIGLNQFIFKGLLRLESYPPVFLELLRQLDSTHVNYYSLKLSCVLFDLLWCGCNEIRRRKILELELLKKPIENLEPLSPIDCIYVSQAFVSKDGSARMERYFCLYPTQLYVLLSIDSSLMRLDDCFPYSSITICDLNDTEDSFNMIQLTIRKETKTFNWNTMFTSPYEKDSLIKMAKSYISFQDCSSTQKEVDKTTNSTISNTSQSTNNIISTQTQTITKSNGSLNNLFVNIRPSYLSVIPVIKQKPTPPNPSKNNESFNFMKNSKKFTERAQETKSLTYILEMYETIESTSSGAVAAATATACKVNSQIAKSDESSSNNKSSKRLLSSLMKSMKSVSPRLNSNEVNQSSNTSITTNNLNKIVDNSYDEKDRLYKYEAMLQYISNVYEIDLEALEKSDDFIKYVKLYKSKE